MAVPAASATTAAAPAIGRDGRKPGAPATKARVRIKGDWLTAVAVGEARAGQPVRKMSGGVAVPAAEDWLVYAGGDQVFDVVTPGQLRERYEIAIEGALTVGPTARRAIEDRLGVGTTATEAALEAAIARLARLAIGEVEIRLTPGQWEEITYQATKNGRSIAQQVGMVVQRIEDELFHGGVATPTGAKV